jgi:hypothetical protein
MTLRIFSEDFPNQEWVKRNSQDEDSGILPHAHFKSCLVSNIGSVHYIQQKHVNNREQKNTKQGLLKYNHSLSHMIMYQLLFEEPKRHFYSMEHGPDKIITDISILVT